MTRGAIRVLSPLRDVTGEMDIDISEAVYTGWIDILTIANVSNRYAMEDCRLSIDLALDTTGFVAVHDSAETVSFRLARKVDGTNYRFMIGENLAPHGETTAVNQTNGADGMLELMIGSIMPEEDVKVQVILSAENADCAFPYRLVYRGPNPTMTAVAAV